MKVLVLNSGSSSIKYELFEMPAERSLLDGIVQRIGQDGGGVSVSCGGRKTSRDVAVPDHEEGFRLAMDSLVECGAMGAAEELDAVGHRVVHGGDVFLEPVVIDDEVVETLRHFSLLAPLHTGPNIEGIVAARHRLPGVPHVAVLDTSFHSTLPPRAYRYAVPRELYEEHGVRRYGFHGTSHRYVANQAAKHLGRPLDTLDVITLHLGNGASACAVQGGRSVDTSMGMTPVEGLVMGTRSGDFDPAAPAYISRATGLSLDKVNAMLVFDSGLLGLCGESDMREVHRLMAEGDKDAELALDVFCYRIRKYIGAYLAVLGRLDAIVFTGGIGENDPEVRNRACLGLEGLGITLDGSRNHEASASKGVSEIQAEKGAVKVLVIPTAEELEIARQTTCVLEADLTAAGHA